MLQFLKKNVLLPQQLILFKLQNTPLGDILHAEQNGRSNASLVEHLAGIQAYCALAGSGNSCSTS